MHLNWSRNVWQVEACSEYVWGKKCKDLNFFPENILRIFGGNKKKKKKGRPFLSLQKVVINTHPGWVATDCICLEIYEEGIQ